MNIVYSMDKNVYKFAIVSFTSLLVNHPDENINLYILASKLPQYIIKDFKKLKKLKDFNLKIIEVNPKEFENLPIELMGLGVSLSIETWFRVKMADLLPEVERVLYLDCDTLIRENISEIYDCEMNDNDIIVRRENIKNRVEELGLKSGWYFNTGVMVCNLTNWRKHNLTQKLLNNAFENKAILKFVDQDVFNITCDLSKISFNSGDVFITWHNDGAEEHKIVHFTGPKPNTNLCINKKYQKEWWNYAKLTPKYFSICFDYFENILKNYIKNLCTQNKC